MADKVLEVITNGLNAFPLFEVLLRIKEPSRLPRTSAPLSEAVESTSLTGRRGSIEAETDVWRYFGIGATGKSLNVTELMIERPETFVIYTRIQSFKEERMVTWPMQTDWTIHNTSRFLPYSYSLLLVLLLKLITIKLIYERSMNWLEGRGGV